MSFTKSVVILLIYCVVIAALIAYQLTQYGIFFHTDIARDFLLFSDIVHNNHITLIGPRSGGIGGVFHGPAWLYLNIPFYLLASGNPMSQGVFWVILATLAAGGTGLSMYMLTRDRTLSVLGGSIAFALFGHSALQLFNPFGATLLSPLAFAALILYYRRPSFIRISILLLTLGTMIQFQMAFAVPILILITPLLIFHSFRSKRKRDLFAFFLLLVPLSTFIMFDLRHNFLQINAVIQYITEASEHTKTINTYNFLLSRARGIIEGVNLLPQWYNGLVFVYFTYVLAKRSKLDHNQKTILYLYLYLFFGYWIITMPYRGDIWGYYTAPFAPLTIIALLSTISVVSRLFKYIIVICVLLFLGGIIFTDVVSAKNKANSPGFWNFYSNVSRVIFDDAPSEFGYFIYTPDEYGYSERYAMKYKDTQTIKTGIENGKKETVYLLIAPAPSDRPGLSSDWWREKRVGIEKKPQRVWKLESGYKIEKYILTSQEQLVPSDSTLINSLIFR